MGGSGTFNVAVRSAVISRLCTAFSLGTGSRKRISPLAMNDAVARCAPATTLAVPVMRVTEASSSAGTVWLKWPPYTVNATSWRVSAMHSEAMTPEMLPGVHSREVSSRSHSPPSAWGRGWGIWWFFRDTAPDRPRESTQEKVKEGDGPSRLSPPNDQRSGHVPYIKVSDIRGLRINVNPTNLVTNPVATRYWGGVSSGLQAWDLITPNRASSNIGEFAILVPGKNE